MREHGTGAAKAAERKNMQSELPALLLPQPKPPRIDDPHSGKAPVVEPTNCPPQPQEAQSEPDPGNTNPGGKSA